MSIDAIHQVAVGVELSAFIKQVAVLLVADRQVDPNLTVCGRTRREVVPVVDVLDVHQDRDLAVDIGLSLDAHLCAALEQLFDQFGLLFFVRKVVDQGLIDANERVAMEFFDRASYNDGAFVGFHVAVLAACGGCGGVAVVVACVPFAEGVFEQRAFGVDDVVARPAHLAAGEGLGLLHGMGFGGGCIACGAEIGCAGKLELGIQRGFDVGDVVAGRAMDTVCNEGIFHVKLHGVASVAALLNGS